MQFCTKCGQQIQEGAQVCIYCGAPVVASVSAQQAYVKKPKKGGAFGAVCAVIAAVALVAVVAVSTGSGFFAQKTPDSSDDNLANHETTKPTQLDPEPEEDPTEPTRPSESTEPSKPTDSTEPWVTIEPTEPIEPTPPTEPPAPPIEPGRIPCTEIIATGQLILSEKGRPLQLGCVLEPADTTDSLSFSSSDPAVVTVDAIGRVTAVGNGKATITITCGDVVRTCKITCILEPDEPSEPEENVPELKLRTGSITIMIKGYVWNAYNGEIDPSQITWTSSDESVCTVFDGKVTCVGPGTATIRAEYKGQVATCKVICNWTE